MGQPDFLDLIAERSLDAFQQITELFIVLLGLLFFFLGLEFAQIEAATRHRHQRLAVELL